MQRDKVRLEQGIKRWEILHTDFELYRQTIKNRQGTENTRALNVEH